MNEFLEKLQSINIGKQERRQPKKTIDVHDHHKVEVTETWDDRQGVKVLPETVRLKIPRKDS